MQSTTTSPHGVARLTGCYRLGLLVIFMLSLRLGTHAQNGPSCDTYVNKTTADGLANNTVSGVYAIGNTVYVSRTGEGKNVGGVSISTDGGLSFINKSVSDGLGNSYVYNVFALAGPTSTTVYAPTDGGLSISTDGGLSFSNKTTLNGLGSNYVYGVYAVSGPGSTTVYAATDEGLGISTDGGITFTNRTTLNGLGNNSVFGVYALTGPGSTTVYAATFGGGVSISTDGGTTFTNTTDTHGLGSNYVYSIYAVAGPGSTTVYAGTDNGLGISTDGGANFTNKTDTDGLGSNSVYGVFAIGSTVYAATEGGLSISTDGGTTFVNRTDANGLGGNYINGVYATANRIYAATNDGLSFCDATSAPSDLSPTLTLPQAFFNTNGSEATRNAVLTLFELGGSPAPNSPIVICLTVPSGYTISYDNSLTSINVTGGETNPVKVDNAHWSVTQNLEDRQLLLTINAGQTIPAHGHVNLGFSITRTTANSGSSSNISVNVRDDGSKIYDSNSANNLYARTISGL